ncbi:MAG: M4 family metallopeptidase [Anaerolineae bacterium]
MMRFTRDRWFSLLLITALLILLATIPTGAQPALQTGSPTPQNLSPAAWRAVQSLLSRGATIAWHERTGVPDFIAADRSRPLPLTVAPSSMEPAQSVALRFFTEYAPLFRMTNPAGELSVDRIEKDDLGMRHVRLTQRVRAWSVFGGTLIVHLTPDNEIVAVNGKFAPQAKVPAKPVLTPAQAYARASQDLAPSGESETGKLGAGASSGPSLRENHLLVFNPALLDYGPDRNYLAYQLVIDDPAVPAIWVVFIDAETGQTLYRYNDLETGKDREIYDLNGGTTLPGTLCYNEAGPSGTPSTDCVDAFNFTGDTYDYFFTNFGRDGFNGAGATMKASVRYDNWANASWNGSQTRFGPGWAVKDVVAHEWTHAVTQYTAGLIYSYQSGALNESFSDVFSVMVDDDDWLQGEDLAIGAIRSLSNPAAFGDPGKLSEYLCTTGDNGGVHTNSSIANHAAYLMAAGDTYNGFTVSGIGRPDTGQIYYRTLSQYLTPISNFGDAYLATLNACYDLYGAGSATCTSAQMALDAVEMNTQVSPCTPVSPGPPDHAGTILNAELAWFGHDPNADVLSYDVFVEAGDPSPDVLACDNATSTTCALGALSPDTTYFWQVVADDGADTVSGPVWHFTTADGQVAGFPFYDGFERGPELVERAGTLGRGWSVSSTDHGEALVSSYAPYAGVYSLLLDDAVADGINSTAALILTIDLAGQSDVNLDFWWREFGDENHVEDGVFISDDDGAAWYQVLSFNNGLSSYQNAVIDMDAAATINGLTLNDHFQIKFQFYDNYPINADGYAIDEVRVYASGGNPPYVPGSPVPVDGATNAYPPSTLEWTSGDADGDSVTYDIYLDTVNPPATLACSDVATPQCAPGSLALDTTYYWQVIADDGSGSSTGPVWSFSTVAKASVPFYDGFEAGGLGAGWWIDATNDGRVWVGPAYPDAGSFSAYLDNRTALGVYSTAALVLLVDLAGQSQAELEFRWREFSDENHTLDGVYISDDDGATWYKVLSFNWGPSSFRRDVIDLDFEAASNGLTLNDHFLIKFQFYDNFPIDVDGYGIDEVWVTNPSAPPTSTATASPTSTTTATLTPTSTTTPTSTSTATVTPTSTATSTPCYDFQPPPDVGMEDVQAVAGRWSTHLGELDFVADYDVNSDEVINIVDIALVAQALGSKCP